MDIIPTYEEYAHCKEEDIVRTAEGNYFIISNHKILTKRIKRASMLASALVAIAFLVLRLNDLAWPILTIDYTVACYLISRLISGIGYRYSEFEIIDPEDPSYEDISRWHVKKKSYCTAPVVWFDYRCDYVSEL